MDLGTFGAIMNYALEVENEISRFYMSASECVMNQNLADLFSDLSNRGQKRVKTLERVRRENVTEMILEPIIGLNSDNYQLVTEIPSGVEQKDVKELAIEIEKGLLEFYTHAAAKIDFLIEAAYSFELLSEANEKALQHLSSLRDSTGDRAVSY